MAERIQATRRAVLQGASALTICASPFGRAAAALTYPDRSVRIIVPLAAGGPSDITARLLSAQLGEALGQTFFIENRPGAGTNLGTATAARSAPDGYTLLVTSSAFVVNPSLYKQVPYDPVKDFAPVTELDTSPNVFIATPASGITSIKQLVERAKANPNELNYASPGIGTTPHLATELLKITAGINITHVPYQGASRALQSILAGTVPIACTSLPGAHPSILGGKLRALAVTGPQRWYDLPDVPSMLELGYPGFVVDTFHCILAPAGTPQEIVSRLSKILTAALKQPKLREQLRALGFEVVANGPDGLRRRIAEEVPRYREIIAKAGIARV